MMQKNNAFARIFNVLVYLFLYLPILTLMVFSFNESKSMFKWSGFSLKWYGEMFRDGQILSAIGNTFLIALLSAAIAILRYDLLPTKKTATRDQNE